LQIHLSRIDCCVVAAYLGGITVVGLAAAGRAKTSAGFFSGNRNFGKAIMIAQSLGTGTHSDQAVGVASAAYTAGLSGIWYQWMWLFATPFYWLLAPLFRRLRVLTTAEFLQLRYGRAYSIVYALFSLYLLALWEGIAIRGTSVTVAAVSGLPEWAIAVVIAGVLTVYSAAGGLAAAAITDLIQGFFIIILSFLVLPFGLSRIGGFEGLHRALDPHYFAIFAQAGGELTVFNVFALVLSGLAGIVAQPHMMAAVATGKTEWNCRIGWTYGNFAKRACTVGWTLTGVLAAVLFPGLSFAEREKSFGLAIALLPTGLLGLMIASLLATAMASGSAFMVDGAALFTEDIYKLLGGRSRSEKHYLVVARVSSIAIAAAGLIFARVMPSVIAATVHFVSILPFVGISIWIGLIWPRANRYGAWACTIGSALVYFAALARGFSNAWASVASLLVGAGSLIAVSWATHPEEKESVDRVFGSLDTPVEGSMHNDGQASLLRDLLVLPRTFSYRAYRVDILGFLTAWGTVGAFILFYWWLAAWS
jgi:Na+/proline symporter